MATMTPWGKSDSKTAITRGLAFHSTPGHGGFLVAKGFAEKNLSPAAIKKGLVYGGYLCYEEDCLANIILLEIPESRKLSSNPITDEELIKSITYYDADYLLERGITPDPEAYERYQQYQLDARMREEKHPNLIVSAMRLSETNVIKVYTADGKTHFVTPESYAKRQGLNLLSNCEIVTDFIQTTDLYY